MGRGGVAAIVPAAGTGRRLGGRTGKPFVAIRRAPLLVHTLRVLQAAPAVRWIILVVAAGRTRAARRLLRRYRITKALPPCEGGASRAESVAKGFARVPEAAEWVLVHDGARPCVSGRLIQHAVSAGRRYGAVACGLPASMTVKAVDARRTVRQTLDRDRLWLVQTPQVFRRDWFGQALARAPHRRVRRFPDDAAMVEAAGFRVRMIPGEATNLKVTTPADVQLAAALLGARASDGAGPRSEPG